jgi:hypothetical protein
MRRYLLILLALVAVAGGATIAISFYQPPMRLMPAPAVFLDERANEIFNELEGPNITLFYATNREAEGP